MMATFNFYGDNNAPRQKIAGRDYYDLAPSDSEAIMAVTALLRKTQLAISAEDLLSLPGDQAAEEMTMAIATLESGTPDAPQRAQTHLARVKEILTAAAVATGLVEAVTKAIDAVRTLC
jgi:hypothetical protein